MSYTKLGPFVDVPDPTNPPAGAVQTDAATWDHVEQGIADASDRADAAYALAQNAGTGGSSSTLGNMGRVWLDSFTGSTDDAKLAAAMSAVGADTYPRGIQLTNRQYSFAAGNITPYEGFRLIGPEGYGNPERNSQTKTPGRVALSMTGPWLTAGTSTIYQVSLHGLSFTGGSGATVIGGSAGQFYCLSMRDIYSSGLKSILGTYGTKLLITAANFDGQWEINNCYDTAFHLGGSDNTFDWSCLLDSGTAFNSSGGSAGHPHFWADSLDKTYVGPMYITAEGDWRGIRHDGPSNPATSGGTNAGYCTYGGIRLEGRNPGQPCKGSLLVVNGGIAELRSSWVAYGMSAPSAGENGAIQHNAGVLDVSGVTYDATSAAQVPGGASPVPFVHTLGGAGLDCMVSRIRRASRGAGTWGTNRPTVKLNSGGAENRITDATVTQA